MKKVIIVILMISGLVSGIIFPCLAQSEEYACYESSNAGLFIIGDGWSQISQYLNVLDSEGDVPNGKIILIQDRGGYYYKICNDPMTLAYFLYLKGVSYLNSSEISLNASAYEISQMDYDGIFIIEKRGYGKYKILKMK